MSIFYFGDFRLDTKNRTLLRSSGEEVSLTPRVFDLLVSLVENNHRVLTKDELLDTIWRDTFVEESNLSQSIFVLRKALADSASNPRFIRTVPSQGYRFIAPVKIESKNGFNDSTVIDAAETLTAEYFKKEQSDQRARGDSGISNFIFSGWPAIVANYFRKAAKPNDSIAVLPFRNATSDVSNDYLTDGFAENVTNKLARLERLKVLAHSVVAKYKNKDIEPLLAGNELRVGAVLAGTLTQDGDRFNLRLELIETATGKLLWGENYKRNMIGIAGLHDEISRKTMAYLRFELTTEEQARMAKRFTEDPEAYVLYLKGRSFWKKATKQSFEKAVEYYNRALELDPNYALAYAGIADCYNLMSEYEYMPPREAFPKARTAALKALEIDNGLAEGHTSLGWVKFSFDWDWSGAELEFLRAIELDPKSYTPRLWYSILLTAIGRFDDAVVETKRLQELDPVTTEGKWGKLYYYLRQYDVAIDYFKKTVESHPNNVDVHWWLVKTYAAKGIKEEAIKELAIILEMAEKHDATQLSADSVIQEQIDFNRGWEYATRQYLRAKIKIRQTSSGTEHVCPMDFALMYAILDDNDAAIAWIEKAFEERTPNSYGFGVDPIWDGLRPDPRFRQILREMRLDHITLPTSH